MPELALWLGPARGLLQSGREAPPGAWAAPPPARHARASPLGSARLLRRTGGGHDILFPVPADTRPAALPSSRPGRGQRQPGGCPPLGTRIEHYVRTQNATDDCAGVHTAGKNWSTALRGRLSLDKKRPHKG